MFLALAWALGTAFKVAAMIELLAKAGGIGGELTRARAMLEFSLAGGLLAVAALICVEYGLTGLVRAELARRREAAQHWRIKR